MRSFPSTSNLTVCLTSNPSMHMCLSWALAGHEQVPSWGEASGQGMAHPCTGLWPFSNLTRASTSTIGKEEAKQERSRGAAAWGPASENRCTQPWAPGGESHSACATRLAICPSSTGRKQKLWVGFSQSSSAGLAFKRQRQ